jgi:sulfate transport system substrate-binding protein
VFGGGAQAAANPLSLLNVSYDPTRELYKAINAAFASYWKSKTGQVLKLEQSHGGSGKQARSVIDGLQADVVTLALAADIDEIAKRAKLLPANWQSRLPEQLDALHLDDHLPGPQGQPVEDPRLAGSAEAGRRRDHAQPEDLRRRALGLSGGLGLWAEERRAGGGAGLCREALQERARCSTPGRAARPPPSPSADRRRAALLGERGAPDHRRSSGPNFDVVYPSISILAEPPVALVDKNVDRHKTRTWPRATSTSSTARWRRTSSPSTTSARATRRRRPSTPDFKQIPLVTIDDTFGGWKKAQATHFADGGVFDQIYKPRDDRSPPSPRQARPHGRAFRVGWNLDPAGLPAVDRDHARLPGPDRHPAADGAGAPAVGDWARRASGTPDRRAVAAALKLSFGLSALAALLNAPLGVLIAWTLTRYSSPAGGCSTPSSTCPSPLPTAVAGIALTAIYAPNRAARLAGRKGGHQDRLFAASASSSRWCSSACRSWSARCSRCCRT